MTCGNDGILKKQLSRASPWLTTEKQTNLDGKEAGRTWISFHVRSPQVHTRWLIMRRLMVTIAVDGFIKPGVADMNIFDAPTASYVLSIRSLIKLHSVKSFSLCCLHLPSNHCTGRQSSPHSWLNTVWALNSFCTVGINKNKMIFVHEY